MSALTPFDRPAGYPSRQDYLKSLSAKGGSALIAAGMALTPLSATAEAPSPPASEPPLLIWPPGESTHRPERKKPDSTPSKPANPSKLQGTPLPPSPPKGKGDQSVRKKGKVVIYPERGADKRPSPAQPSQQKPGESVKPPASPPKQDLRMGGRVVRKPVPASRTPEDGRSSPGESVKPPKRG